MGLGSARAQTARPPTSAQADAKGDRDLRVLIEPADAEDLEEARQLIGLITERGYHRGGDLGARHLARALRQRTAESRRPWASPVERRTLPAGSPLTLARRALGRTPATRCSGR